MQDTELFLSLAEIAGVFVGFGALIAVRSGGPAEAGDITGIRWVMSTAIFVVIAALAPILVSGYGVGGHALWLACSLLALVLFAVVNVVNARTPENRSELAAHVAVTPRRMIVAVYGPTIWLPVVAVLLALALVLLGIFPDQEHALYLTAVGLGLFMGAMGLFVMVFERRRRPAPSDQGGLAAPGGSSA